MVAAMSCRIFIMFFVSRSNARNQRGRYLLRHHTERPASKSAPGKRNWLLRRTQLNCAPVMLTLRSSGGFGRMEIKSSSEESQFIAFNARSLLPLNERKEFATQEELPTTTKRPCEFSFPVVYVPAAAMVSGPRLLFGSLGFMLGVSNLVVARLESE